MAIQHSEDKSMFVTIYSDKLLYMYAEYGYSPKYVQMRAPVLVICYVRCTGACCPGVHVFAVAITACCPVFMEISFVLWWSEFASLYNARTTGE